MASDEPVASAVDLQFKEPLEIVKYPDLRLRAKNKRVGTFDESLKSLADKMFDVMYRTNGIGLAAPQVGINVQLMVFNPGVPGEGDETILINPCIKGYSEKIVPFTEGCLSLPGFHAVVERPHALKVDAQDITGERIELNLTGLPARVFQHEYDHLQGILFFDRLSVEVLDRVRVHLQALEKAYEERTGLPSPEMIDTSRSRKKIGESGEP